MKIYTLKELFNIVDGRLSTKIDDVYDILNWLTGENLMTHQLPTAMKFINNLTPLPDWYIKAYAEIHNAKEKVGNEFELLMNYIEQHNTKIEVEALSESQLDGFCDFMVENSLLKTIGSALTK